MARLVFADEKAVETYIANILRSRGERVHQAVKCRCLDDTLLEADIVTRTTVIEVVQILDRDAIYHALGQAVTYARILGKSRIKVMGQTSLDPATKAQAYRLKGCIEAPGSGRFSGRNIEVIFIDEDPRWMPTPPNQYKVGIIELTLLIVAALVLITTGLNFARQGSYSYPPSSPPLPRIKCEPSLPNC